MDMAASPCSKSRVNRLLIADDRMHTRRALGAMLATHPGFESIGQAHSLAVESSDEALAARADACCRPQYAWRHPHPSRRARQANPPVAPEIREARAFSETEGYRWARRARSCCRMRSMLPK